VPRRWAWRSGSRPATDVRLGGWRSAQAHCHLWAIRDGCHDHASLEAVPLRPSEPGNAHEPRVHVLDGEGYGTSGGGPEEFRSPAGLLQGGLDGEAWVFDFVRHAFIRVSEGDGAWAEVALPREDIPSGSVRGGMSLITSTVRTASLGDQLIVPWTTGTVESGIASYYMALLRANLAAVDPRTGSVHNVVSLGEVLEDPSDGGVREVQLPDRFDALRFTPERTWGIRRDTTENTACAASRVGHPER